MTIWKDFWFTETAENQFNAALGNMKLNLHTGRMEPRFIEMPTESNWAFYGQSFRHMDCGRWHGIYHKHYNLIPEYCRLRCYKVVVKFPTVETLMRYHNFIRTTPAILETITPIYGKCGIDERYYSDTPYDAFLYCNGLEDGLERYALVRDLITKHFTFNPDLPVILKRSCTEFEKSHGPTDSDFWNNYSEEERDLELRLNDIYATQYHEIHQPEWLLNKIYRRWIKFANTFGDKSWLNYWPDADDDLTMKAVTYHHLLDEQGEEPETLNKLYQQVGKVQPLEYPTLTEMDEQEKSAADAQTTLPFRKE